MKRLLEIHFLDFVDIIVRHSQNLLLFNFFWAPALTKNVFSIYFSRWFLVNKSRNKRVSTFLLCFIGFETIKFYTFVIKMSCFGSNSFFKLQNFLNYSFFRLQKPRTLFCTAVFFETLYKISRQTGKPFWYYYSGNMAIFDFNLFRL